MAQPLVSICLPNLNTRRFLPARMDSILAQTLTDWELIICDSYSDDGSWEFFQKFGRDSRVRLYQVPRAGLYAGWNECLRRVKGRYVYIATSDDTCEPRLLERLVGVLECHPDVAMASCNFRFVDENDRVVEGERPNGAEIYGEWLMRPHRRHGISEFVAACAAGPVWSTVTSILFRRALLDEIGFFPENKMSIADFEWGIRAPLFTDTIHIPEPLATWRIRRGQATRSLDWAKYAWSYVDMVRAVWQQFHHRLPERLRSHAAFRELVRPRVYLAFDCLRLYPSELRRRPWRTIRNLGLGFWRSPGLTLRHLLTGGSWSRRPQLNLKTHVEQQLRNLDLTPLCSPLTEPVLSQS